MNSATHNNNNNNKEHENSEMKNAKHESEQWFLEPINRTNIDNELETQ
jgi:hypothetical protein